MKAACWILLVGSALLIVVGIILESIPVVLAGTGFDMLALYLSYSEARRIQRQCLKDVAKLYGDEHGKEVGVRVRDFT